MRAHYKKHEGIHVFHYETNGGGHGAFDRFLELLHERANPAAILGRRLEGKRILWMDPTDYNNVIGRKFLDRAARGICTITLVETPEQALTSLAAAKYDLVLSRWGHQTAGSSDAAQLLEGMRRRDLRAPVIIFASGDFAEQNRELALTLGALEYTSSWQALFQAIDRRFSGPP